MLRVENEVWRVKLGREALGVTSCGECFGGGGKSASYNVRLSELFKDGRY